MRPQIIPGIAFIGEAFANWFLPGLRFVILSPLFEVSLTQLSRVGSDVVARASIFARLRKVRNSELGDFQNPLGTLEAIDFRSFTTEIEAQVDGNWAIFVNGQMNVGHVAAIGPAQNPT